MNLLLFLQTLQRFQNAVCARIHSDRRAIASGEDSVLIDDEESALRNSFCTSIRAVCARNAAFGLKVREQRKVQVTGFPLIVPLAGSRSRLRNRAGSASPASSTAHKLACRRQDAYRFHAAKLPEA
jgi:hypothetical protein